MRGDFEFWTLKHGPDGLTWISVRVSGQGRRESWLVATEETEGDVMKSWAAEHLDWLGLLPACDSASARLEKDHLAVIVELTSLSLGEASDAELRVGFDSHPL